MNIGLFLEFPRRENSTYQEAFQEGFALVDEAESLGIQSVWLAEYHFNAGCCPRQSRSPAPWRPAPKTSGLVWRSISSPWEIRCASPKR